MKKYHMNDGTSYTVQEAMARMLELHDETASLSLMQQRMAHSQDPEYCFMKKGVDMSKTGGHAYSVANQARKVAARNSSLKDRDVEKKVSTRSKKIKQLTDKELALRAAYKLVGLTFGGSNGYTA
jgi:hypothetical protein|tara:strand:+ start:938 stop:1312 length:375 start_codon:yes stop_codon:yes gene_type:complete